MGVQLKTRPEDVVGYIQITPGERLRGMRDLMGLTQTELEAASGVKQNDISAIERDKKSMGLIVARKLAGGLGVPVSRLIDESVQPNESERLSAVMDSLKGKSEEYIAGLMEAALKLEKFKRGSLVMVKRNGPNFGFKVVTAKKTRARKKAAVKKKVAAKKAPSLKTA